MAEEEETVLMCSPVAWGCHIPGTIQIEAACRHQVYVAPSGVEIIKKHNATAKCIPCGLKDESVKEALTQQATITEAQRVELNEVIGVGETDQMIAKLNLKETE